MIVRGNKFETAVRCPWWTTAAGCAEAVNLIKSEHVGQGEPNVRSVPFERAGVFEGARRRMVNGPHAEWTRTVTQ